MRVLVLMHEDLIPPESRGSKEEWEKAAWKTEFDVLSHLKAMGHEAVPLGVGSELGVIRTELHHFKPHIVFNLLEEFRGQAFFDYHIVAYLELMQAKYTGCNPRGLLLSRDKALGKKILKYHRISTPDFQVFRRSQKLKVPKALKYPLFVKTLNEEASLGIAQGSVVETEKALRERVEYLFEQFQTDVIAETYVDGREFYVSVIGNDRLQTFPLVELEFGTVGENSYPIATRKVKWDLAYRKKHGVLIRPPKDLEPDLEKKIYTLCKRAYRALDLSGYARMDLRVSSAGTVHLIEANPNPDIGFGDEFHKSAELNGWDYPRMLQKLLNLGLSWDPTDS